MPCVDFQGCTSGRAIRISTNRSGGRREMAGCATLPRICGSFRGRRDDILGQKGVEGIGFSRGFQEPLYDQSPARCIECCPGGAALFHDAGLLGSPDSVRILITSFIGPDHVVSGLSDELAPADRRQVIGQVQVQVIAFLLSVAQCGSLCGRNCRSARIFVGQQSDGMAAQLMDEGRFEC